MLALGILAAVGASVLYNTSIALQALEARDVPHEHSLRISLIGKLVRNPKWLGATALGLLGWPLEIVAWRMRVVANNHEVARSRNVAQYAERSSSEEMTWLTGSCTVGPGSI